jgi:hypothetical protein
MIEILKLGADGGSGAFKGDGGTGSQKRSNEGNEENEEEARARPDGLVSRGFFDFSVCSVASF